MHTTGYHSNDLLNFYVLHNVQNVDNITKFEIGQNSKLV